MHAELMMLQSTHLVLHINITQFQTQQVLKWFEQCLVEVEVGQLRLLI
jgi:hypothetical protein